MSHVPRVLIVEDEEPLRRVLRTALYRAGYSVADAGTARAAQEALEVAGSLGLPFDLLVVDIGLPDQTGWQLLRRLRMMRPSAASTVDATASQMASQIDRSPLRVIVLSALRPAECRLQEFRPAGLLIKPFPLDALVQLVDRVLRGSEDGLAGFTDEAGEQSLAVPIESTQ